MALDTLALIDAIYGAIVEPERWTALLPALTDFVGGNAAALQAPALPNRNPNFEIYRTHNVDADAAADFVENHLHEDIFSARMVAMAAGAFDQPVSGLRAVDFEVVSKSWMWNEHFARVDAGDIASVFLATPRDRAWPVLTLVNPRKGMAFDEGQLARLQTLTPHLRAATSLRLRLLDRAGAGADEQAVLDASPAACVAIDRHGVVVAANAKAAALGQPGGALRLRQGKLSACEPAADARLKAAIRRAVGGLPRIGAEVLLPGDAPVLAVVTPINAENPFVESERARALVHLLTPVTGSNPARTQRRLRLLFGLSPAAAQVGADLILGATPEVIAETRNRSVNTVRAQVRDILSRTGTRRVSEFQALRRLIDIEAES